MVGVGLQDESEKKSKTRVFIPEHEIYTSGREHSLQVRNSFRFARLSVVLLTFWSFGLGRSITAASASACITADVEVDVVSAGTGVEARRECPPFPSLSSSEYPVGVYSKKYLVRILVRISGKTT